MFFICLFIFAFLLFVCFMWKISLIPKVLSSSSWPSQCNMLPQCCMKTPPAYKMPLYLLMSVLTYSTDTSIINQILFTAWFLCFDLLRKTNKQANKNISAKIDNNPENAGHLRETATAKQKLDLRFNTSFCGPMKTGDYMRYRKYWPVIYVNMHKIFAAPTVSENLTMFVASFCDSCWVFTVVNSFFLSPSAFPFLFLPLSLFLFVWW